MTSIYIGRIISIFCIQGLFFGKFNKCLTFSFYLFQVVTQAVTLFTNQNHSAQETWEGTSIFSSVENISFYI